MSQRMSFYICAHVVRFFFNDTATTEIYTLSLHDALPITAAMTEASPDAPDAYLARIAQARALRVQASKGGLRFEAYLPPDLAEWLLDLIERGVFGDPSEAVFVMLGEHRDLEPHDDLRHELLQRTVQAAIDDPRPSLSGNEVETQLRELADTPLPEAAIWRKIP